jgi:hypothetical protein
VRRDHFTTGTAPVVVICVAVIALFISRDNAISAGWSPNWKLIFGCAADSVIATADAVIATADALASAEFDIRFASDKEERKK